MLVIDLNSFRVSDPLEVTLWIGRKSSNILAYFYTFKGLDFSGQGH